MTDLKTFTHGDKDLYFGDPFTLVDRQGRVWNCACDRVWFLAIKGKGQYPRWKGGPGDLNNMVKFLQGEPDQAIEVDAEQLVTWAANVEEDECVMLGVVLTPKKLQQLVETAGGVTIQVWVGTKTVGDARSVILGYEGHWRAVLMGHETEPKKSMATFSNDNQEQSLFDMAMAMGAD